MRFLLSTIMSGLCLLFGLKIPPVLCPNEETITNKPAFRTTLFYFFAGVLLFEIVFNLEGTINQKRFFFFFSVCTLILSAADSFYFLLPNTLLVTAASGYCLWLFLFYPTFILEAFIGAVILFLLLYCIFSFTSGMGGGDVKLAALIGGILGWQDGLKSLLAACSAVFLFLGFECFFKKKSPKEKIPFGPFLFLGCWLILLYRS